MTPADGTGAPRFARIWDAPVRLFHWLLVAMLGISWWTGERHEMEWHRLSGYVILGLLIFRIWWGFAGSRTARFAGFVRGPRTVIAYARGLFRAPYLPAPGHNPIGGWSVIVMIATLAAMVLTGLFAVDIDGLESGPLSDLVEFDTGRLAATIHHWLFNAVLALSALHVAAILLYLVGKRHNLIAPMIHGRRRLSAGDTAEPLTASPLLAMIGIVAAILIVVFVSRGLRI